MTAEELITKHLEAKGKVPDAFKKYTIKKGENKPTKKEGFGEAKFSTEVGDE